jgi:hypothetical protein
MKTETPIFQSVASAFGTEQGPSISTNLALFKVNDFGWGFGFSLYSSRIRQCVGGEAMIG